MSRMSDARTLAAMHLADHTITPEERIGKVISIFPGGNTDIPEYAEAVELARGLQDAGVVNCGACYAPEKCVPAKRCRRLA